MDFNTINFLFNPLRRLPTYGGDAHAPTLYDYDKNGLISPSNGREVSAQERAAIDKYNDQRRSLNAEQQAALDDYLKKMFPLSWPEDPWFGSLPPDKSPKPESSEPQECQAPTKPAPSPGPLDQPDFSDPEVQRLIEALADAFNNAQNQASPIILDLDGNGVQTVGLDAGVHFDHNANGFAQQTGWVGQGDGLLAANQAHWRQAA